MGNNSESTSRFEASKSLQSKADYEAKAAEAVKAGKSVLAAGYSKAGINSRIAADELEQSAVAKTQKRESNYINLVDTAQVSQRKANEIAKSAELENSR